MFDQIFERSDAFGVLSTKIRVGAGSWADATHCYIAILSDL
jgi:hypothetical protein